MSKSLTVKAKRCFKDLLGRPQENQSIHDKGICRTVQAKQNMKKITQTL